MEHRETPQSSPPRVEAEAPTEETLSIVRVLTRMMDEREERLKVEMRAMMTDLIIQAYIEDRLFRRKS